MVENQTLEVIKSTTSLPTSIFTSSKELEDYLCVICNEIANPHTAVEHVSCGHIFCESCLNLWINKNPSCPFCRETIVSSSNRAVETSNKFLYRHLSALEMKCPSTLFGQSCDWMSSWSNLADHLKLCQKVPNECSNGCGHICLSQNIALHQEVECPDRPVKCEFCASIIKFKELDKHREICKENPEVIFPCKYNYIGCTFNGKKDERLQHEESEDKAHFEIALAYINIELKTKKLEEAGKKINEQQVKEKNVRVSIHCHPLKFIIKDNGWRCDGKNFSGGCKSGLTHFNQTYGVDRYRCNSCDFDLCNKCMSAYYTGIE